MDLIREVSGETPFWSEIPGELPAEAKQGKDMTRLEREHIQAANLIESQNSDTSGKNVLIAGFFYFMAFIMFFTELRIISLFHCLFGTLFMFF